MVLAVHGAGKDASDAVNEHWPNPTQEYVDRAAGVQSAGRDVVHRLQAVAAGQSPGSRRPDDDGGLRRRTCSVPGSRVGRICFLSAGGRESPGIHPQVRDQADRPQVPARERSWIGPRWAFDCR